MNGERFPTPIMDAVDEDTLPVHRCVPGCPCSAAHAAGERMLGAARFLQAHHEIAQDPRPSRVESRAERFTIPKRT